MRRPDAGDVAAAVLIALCVLAMVLITLRAVDAADACQGARDPDTCAAVYEMGGANAAREWVQLQSEGGE